MFHRTHHHVLLILCRSSSGCRATFYSVKRKTRRAGYQSRRPHEEGKIQLDAFSPKSLFHYHNRFVFVVVQNAETVKVLSSTKQAEDHLLRTKEQLEREMEHLRQEQRNMVRTQTTPSDTMNSFIKHSA